MKYKLTRVTSKMAYISEKNKYVEDYLDYYCSSKINNYAILIDGDWGEGKSWFIKKYIEKYKKKESDLDVIYISLNGINNKESIDDQIFAVLFPVLSNPKLKAIGRVITNSIKLAVKIDLSEDNDPTATLSIPESKIFNDLLKRDKKLLLIFDDFERCELGMKEILGYINYFVEYSDCKAIIIANQNKIDNREIEIFHTEKEKLICATLKLIGDFKVAFNYFIDYLGNDIKSMLINNFELIEKCFIILKCNNIRILKQSLYGFERLNSLIEFKNEPKLVENFITRYFFYSICLKSNFIDLNFKDQSYSFEIKNEKDCNNELYSLIDKVLNDYRVEYIINEKIWNDIVGRNIIDVGVICQKIKQNYFDLEKQNFAWLKIVNYLKNDIKDDDFRYLYSEMLSDLKNSKYEEIGDIYHTISNIIYFRSITKDISISEQKSIAFEQIKRLCKKMEREEVSLLPRLSGEYKKGFEYLAIGVEEFREFIVEVKKYIEEYQSINLEKDIDILVDLIGNDIDKLKNFRDKIYYNEVGAGGIYYKFPILEKIDKNKFVNKLLALKRNNMLYMVHTITDRFQGLHRTFHKVEWIDSERLWIKDVYQLLGKESKKLNDLDRLFLEKNILEWIKGHVLGSEDGIGKS